MNHRCYKYETKIIKQLGESYVTRTRLEVSDLDTCPCVRLGNILKNVHVFGLKQVSESKCPCPSVERPTRVLRGNMKSPSNIG